ncbi:peptidase M15 [Phaeobacter sp. HS012]|uniref:peptidase M15 n=1 Tax=unclassified Phaeobacter TaxID=2621772 RepID=UPI001B3703E6|nr:MULTISPECIES: peptidase M15 [unclassified Phaeobacter]MBQ4808093.1 peptidase M15 [Phaeobacter sp. HS012]MBQ4882942.1 peptidase M15 [Phaeobacter sp. HS011]
MKSTFWELERLGRIKLSKHFTFRQFLHSEIAAAYGVVNMPDDAELAIEVGRGLCANVLEPIVSEFGPIIVRSGFRSASLNALGHRLGLKCASNEKNYAAHIWDHRDADGNAGASACIIVPAFNEGHTDHDGWQDLADHLIASLPCTEPKRFKNDNAFNIGWKQPPSARAQTLPGSL